MTLIRALITRFGIIQASDSNLSYPDRPGGVGRKVFRLTFTRGAVALAGQYKVAGQTMDTWMLKFISDYARTADPTIGGFAQQLNDALAVLLRDAQEPCLYHVAGYARNGKEWHPEMWCVRNVDLNEKTGDYEVTGNWQVTEEFWAGHYREPMTRQALESGGFQHYINGTTHGRIALNALQGQIWGMLNAIWANVEFDFRAPRDLDELGRIVDIELRLIGAMYRSSFYRAPYIGGRSQICKIKPPKNTVEL